jgi:hypothetical protein
MAGRASLNAKNLEALGPARLAALLLLHTEGNIAARRALRLALAEQQGPLEMAQEVRKRLAAVERSSSGLDQKKEAGLGVEAVTAGHHSQIEVVAGLALPGRGSRLAHGSGWRRIAWARIARQWGEGEQSIACQRS